ncbi:hypothetical protein RB195_024067 [Necator americanus]|uniref:Anaphylatoxin-like domain-containing protein n=1 Tax=Necator americanus TaxID=51031 RepID=A0ABR1ELP6_NECAM
MNKNGLCPLVECSEIAEAVDQDVISRRTQDMDSRYARGSCQSHFFHCCKDVVLEITRSYRPKKTTDRIDISVLGEVPRNPH